MFVLLLRLGVVKNVVYKHHDKLIKIGFEHPMHEVHAHHWDIRQTKQHNHELEVVLCLKCYLRNISIPYLQLFQLMTLFWNRHMPFSIDQKGHLLVGMGAYS